MKFCPNKQELKKKGVDFKNPPYKPKDKTPVKEEDPSAFEGDILACMFVGEISDQRFVDPRVAHLDSCASTHGTSSKTILSKLEKVPNPYPVIGALGGKAEKIEEVGRISMGSGQSLGNVAYIKGLQMTLVSEPRLMDSTQHGVIIVKDKDNAKIYLPNDVEIVERNPPRLVFPRKGAFWARQIEYAGQRPEEQLKGPDLEYNSTIRARERANQESDASDDGEAEYEHDNLSSQASSTSSSSGAGQSSTRTIPKHPKRGRGGRGGRHF
jgi:hypothetical protein